MSEDLQKKAEEILEAVDCSDDCCEPYEGYSGQHLNKAVHLALVEGIRIASERVLEAIENHPFFENTGEHVAKEVRALLAGNPEGTGDKSGNPKGKERDGSGKTQGTSVPDSGMVNVSPETSQSECEHTHKTVSACEACDREWVEEIERVKEHALRQFAADVEKIIWMEDVHSLADVRKKIEALKKERGL